MKFIVGWPAVLSWTLLAALMPAAGSDKVAPDSAAPSVSRSIFIQPGNPREGCDPFFPTSTRLFASLVVAPAADPTDLSGLVLEGTSGTQERPLVIINHVTFAVGDDREVVTTQGRMQIQCIEIVGDTAVVEAHGQRRQLRYMTKYDARTETRPVTKR